MARRNEIDTLKAIGEICEAQRARAELEVGRLNLEVERLVQRRDVETGRLKASQDGWQKAVTGASLHLTASAAWSAEILRNRAVIANTEDDIRTTRAHRQAQCEALTAASARNDAVAAMTVKAVRTDMRRREEMALEGYEARATQGWRAS